MDFSNTDYFRMEATLEEQDRFGGKDESYLRRRTTNTTFKLFSASTYHSDQKEVGTLRVEAWKTFDNALEELFVLFKKTCKNGATRLTVDFEHIHGDNYSNPVSKYSQWVGNSYSGCSFYSYCAQNKDYQGTELPIINKDKYSEKDWNAFVKPLNQAFIEGLEVFLKTYPEASTREE